MKHSIAVAILLAGCSGGAASQTDGPLPGESQDCGVGGYQLYDGSSWGPCEDPNAETTEQSPSSDAQEPDLSSTTQNAGSASSPTTQTSEPATPAQTSTPTQPSTPAQPPPPPTQSLPVTPAPTPSCFTAGDGGSVGCGSDAAIQCCEGALCIDVGADSICAATCSTAAECTSGCCVPLADGSGSVCVGADACVAPPPPPAATYELTNIDRIASNFYKATSGDFTELVIQTRLCLALTLRDDGLLVEAANGELELYIDNSSSDVCEVAEVYVADPPFGTFSLTGIEQVGSDIYSAQSGAAALIIETQLCLALPVFDDGVLAWDVVGSQVVMDTPSGDVCDVVNVYSN